MEDQTWALSGEQYQQKSQRSLWYFGKVVTAFCSCLKSFPENKFPNNFIWYFRKANSWLCHMIVLSYYTLTALSIVPSTQKNILLFFCCSCLWRSLCYTHSHLIPILLLSSLCPLSLMANNLEENGGGATAIILMMIYNKNEQMWQPLLSHTQCTI